MYSVVLVIIIDLKTSGSKNNVELANRHGCMIFDSVEDALVNFQKKIETIFATQLRMLVGDLRQAVTGISGSGVEVRRS